MLWNSRHPDPQRARKSGPRPRPQWQFLGTRRTRPTHQGALGVSHGTSSQGCPPIDPPRTPQGEPPTLHGPFPGTRRTLRTHRGAPGVSQAGALARDILAKSPPPKASEGAPDHAPRGHFRGRTRTGASLSLSSPSSSSSSSSASLSSSSSFLYRNSRSIAERRASTNLSHGPTHIRRRFTRRLTDTQTH